MTQLSILSRKLIIINSIVGWNYSERHYFWEISTNKKSNPIWLLGAVTPHCESVQMRCFFGEFRLSRDRERRLRWVAASVLMLRLQLLSPKGQILGWKEYTPCLLVKVLQLHTSHYFTADSNTGSTQHSEVLGSPGRHVLGPVAVIPPRLTEHVAIHSNWGPTTVSRLRFIPTAWNETSSVREGRANSRDSLMTCCTRKLFRKAHLTPLLWVILLEF